uniref:Uncharacterized protein n=1 Tax=Aegilops tauschii subsp. strangulata TaxID=200361 RepID=A0A453PZK3_AEGTS
KGSQGQGRVSTSLPTSMEQMLMGTAQYIHQKNGPQVVTFMLEERQGCFSGQSLLLEFCWAVLCLSTILVPWLL